MSKLLYILGDFAFLCVVQQNKVLVDIGRLSEEPLGQTGLAGLAELHLLLLLYQLLELVDRVQMAGGHDKNALL